MSRIHPTAIVDKGADIDPSAEIGPYSIVGPDVKIGKDVKIGAHANICRYTEIGDGTVVHMGAVLGNTPQDLAFKDEPSYLKIGKGNVIREYATLHRGTKAGSSTIVGDNNFLMAMSHVGHNCHIHNTAIIANGALLAGYVEVEDMAFISGNVVIHQFCRIGKLAIIGGFSGVNKDVPPFMAVRGPSVVWSINMVGLRRGRIPREEIAEIKQAYNIMYLSGLNTDQAIEEIEKTLKSPSVVYFLQFIKNSKRGICKYKFGGDDSKYFADGGDE